MRFCPARQRDGGNCCSSPISSGYGMEGLRVHSPGQTELCIYTSEILAGGRRPQPPLLSSLCTATCQGALKQHFFCPSNLSFWKIFQGVIFLNKKFIMWNQNNHDAHKSKMVMETNLPRQENKILPSKMTSQQINRCCKNCVK